METRNGFGSLKYPYRVPTTELNQYKLEYFLAIYNPDPSN